METLRDDSLLSSLRVAAIQSSPRLFDVEGNLRYIAQHITSTDADIIVFTELSTCGYFLCSKDEAASVAMSPDDERIRTLCDLATEHERTVILGFAEKAGEHVYNSALIVRPGMEPVVYRKTHLFYKEKYCFLEGDTGFFVVEEPKSGARIGVMICYDWRFPEAARTLALQGADLIVCPANLVTTLSSKVMPARAIENKVNLVVANRYGTETRGDETLLFRGESAMYDYHGNVLAVASADRDEVLFANLDCRSTRKKSFNSENDIFNDRRPSFYEC